MQVTLAISGTKPMEVATLAFPTLLDSVSEQEEGQELAPEGRIREAITSVLSTMPFLLRWSVVGNSRKMCVSTRLLKPTCELGSTKRLWSQPAAGQARKRRRRRKTNSQDLAVGTLAVLQEGRARVVPSPKRRG